MKQNKHYTYEELRAIGKKYYNDAGFCAVIAVAIACKTSYGKAHAMLEREGRVNGQGTAKWMIDTVINKMGYKLSEVDGFYNKQVKSLTAHFKSGVYVVYVRGHVLTIRNGIIEDWTAERAHRVIKVYKID